LASSSLTVSAAASSVLSAQATATATLAGRVKRVPRRRS